MSTRLELRIPKSSSSNLPKALAIARTFDRFKEPGRATSYTLLVQDDELRDRYGDFESLYTMIRGWKGTQLLINQRLSGLERLRVVLEVFRCAEGRTEAVMPESFCQPGHEPGWGYKRLTTIRAGLPVASWQVQRESYWFQFGRFDKACEAWHVDKRRLLKALVREAALKHVGLCPFFNKETVQQQVAALPDKIELEEDSAWTILYSVDHPL